MQINSSNFDWLNLAKSKQPLYVIEIAFDDAFTDLVYFTSDSSALTPTGFPVYHSVVKNISGSSQKVNPIKAIATIGNINFSLVDVDQTISDLFRSKLDNQKSLRRKRVRVYLGFGRTNETDPTLTWDDYVLVPGGTQIINNDSFNAGYYSIRCVDIQREQTKDLFVPKTTNLAQNISADDQTIPVLDTTEFELVKRSLADTDAPGLTTNYIKIDDEIIRFESKTPTAFENCTRGVLGSTKAPHEIDGSKPIDKRKKVEEYIHLEDNAISMAYQILTGKRYGTTDQLPAHWTMGINEAYVRAADFFNIGTDWYDPSDIKKGVRLRFDGLKKSTGKLFIDKMIYQVLGAYSPIYADGSFGLKRMSVMLDNASYVAVIDKSMIVRVSELKRNEEMVFNRYLVEWNWDDINQQYTRNYTIRDDTSIATYGETDLISLQLRGVYGNSHTKYTLLSRLDALRSRYAAPPLTISVTCLPSANMLEVGDVVRLRYDNIRDYAGVINEIDRSFEIQSVKIDWKTGLVTLDLFGSTARASLISDIAPEVSIGDSVYSARGTELKGFLDANYPGSYDINGDRLTIKSNVDLPGNASMNDSAAIYYWLGDLTINTGVVVSSSTGGNVQFRVRGFFQNNGDLTSIGTGHPGAPQLTATSAYEPRPSATLGLVGTSWGGPNIKRTLLTANGGRDIRMDKLLSNMVSYNGEFTGTIYSGGVSQSTFPELTLKATATDIEGIPDDFRGGGGCQGGHLDRGYAFGDARNGIRSGGAGGAGGGGFAIICRGFSCGSAGRIITSGLPGSDGESISTGSGTSRTLHAGKGGGGTPGAVGIFIDGKTSIVGSINLVAEYGSNLPASGLNVMTNMYMDTASVADPVYGFYQAISGLSLEALKVQYIPDPEEPVVDTQTYAEYPASFTATLVPNSPKTANAAFSSIEVDVSPPSDTNYSYSNVYYKKATDLDWQFSGIADNSWVISGLDANGDLYDVQVRSVSIDGVENKSGPQTTVLLNSIIDAPQVVIKVPNVTGLELFDEGGGKGNNHEFQGKEIKIRWRRSSLDESYDFGNEAGNLGADAGQDSLYFQDYQVDVYNVTTGKLVRTDYVKDNSFLYTYEKNVLDNGTAQRQLRFEVWARSRQNQRSETSAKITVINPPPGPPSNISLIGGPKFIGLSFTAPDDLDYIATNVYLDTVAGFTPGPSTLVTTLRATDDLMISKDGSGSALLDNTEYFVKLEPIDAFSETGSVTAAISATTAASTEAPINYRYEGLNFKANDPATNQVSWNAGTGINGNDGSSWSIVSGNATWTTGTLYLYNVPTSNTILSTTVLTTAVTGNILATYRGSTNLQNGDNGGAFIDGGTVLAQTIGANQMAANSITAANGAIANLAVKNANIDTVQIDKLTTGSLTGQVLTGGQIQTASSGKRIVLNEASSNEIGFYGDRGDGTLENLAQIGITPYGTDNVIGLFGTPNSDRWAILAQSSNMAIWGHSTGNLGVYATTAGGLAGLQAEGTGSFSHGVYAYSKNKTGGRFLCDSVTGEGPICLVAHTSSAAPTHVAEKGTLWVTSQGVVYINTDDSTGWKKMVVGGSSIVGPSGSISNQLSLHTSLTESTWTLVGPTGSGATVIWSALDSLDLNTSHIICQTRQYVGNSAAGKFPKARQYWRPTGDTGTPVIPYGEVQAVTDSTNAGVFGNVGQVHIKLDYQNRFELMWEATDDTERNLTLHLVSSIL